MSKLRDVVAVNLETNKVRILDRNKTTPNAEAIVNMAVMRRGVDEECFADVASGTYAEGDEWRGDQEAA